VGEPTLRFICPLLLIRVREEKLLPKERVTDIVEQLASPIVTAAGLELIDVEFKKEGANWFLRVFIDKQEGIDIDDCSRVSEQLSLLLDEVDPISDAYFLEVSSPGAERPLKKMVDYERAVGQRVHVSLYEPLNGSKTFEGLLASFDGITLEMDYVVKTVVKHALIPFDKVAAGRLAITI